MLLSVGCLVYLIVCGWALWRGGTSLRIAALLALLSTGLGLVYELPEAILFPVDIVLMLAMIALSLVSRRLWTLLAGALMIDRVATYALHDIERVDTLAWICAFGLLLCLAAGILEQESGRTRVAASTEVKSANG